MNILDKKHLLLGVSFIAMGVLPTVNIAQACSQSRSVQCTGHLGDSQVVGDTHCVNAIPAVNYPSYGSTEFPLGSVPVRVRSCPCPPPPPDNGGGYVDLDGDGVTETHIRDAPPGDYPSSDNKGEAPNDGNSSKDKHGHYDGDHEGGDTGRSPPDNDR